MEVGGGVVEVGRGWSIKEVTSDVSDMFFE